MRNSLSVHSSNVTTQRSIDYQAYRNNDYETIKAGQSADYQNERGNEYQYYTRQQRQKAEPLGDNTNINFLSTQISEFMASQQKESERNYQVKFTSHKKNSSQGKHTSDRKFCKIETLSVSKQKSQDLQQLFHNIEMQKKILEDQQKVHEFQTQFLQKQLTQGIRRCDTVFNTKFNQMTQELKQMTADPSLTQSTQSLENKHPMIKDHIVYINDDINTLADFFQNRQLFKRVFRVIKRNKVIKSKQENLRKYRMICLSFFSLIKNTKQSQINRLEQQKLKQIFEHLRN